MKLLKNSSRYRSKGLAKKVTISSSDNARASLTTFNLGIKDPDDRGMCQIGSELPQRAPKQLVCWQSVFGWRIRAIVFHKWEIAETIKRKSLLQKRNKIYAPWRGNSMQASESAMHGRHLGAQDKDVILKTSGTIAIDMEMVKNYYLKTNSEINMKEDLGRKPVAYIGSVCKSYWYFSMIGDCVLKS